MSNLLDSILGEDAAFAFCDPDTFGESVTYTPNGGTARTITAVIERDPPAPIDAPAGDPKRPKMIATIRNHATLGADSIDSGGDTITVAYRKGGTARAYAVGAPISQDAGCWKVSLM